MQDLLTVPLSAKRKRYLQQLDVGIDQEAPDAKKARTGGAAQAEAGTAKGHGSAPAPGAANGQQVSLRTVRLKLQVWAHGGLG